MIEIKNDLAKDREADYRFFLSDVRRSIIPKTYKDFLKFFEFSRYFNSDKIPFLKATSVYFNTTISLKIIIPTHSGLNLNIMILDDEFNDKEIIFKKLQEYISNTTLCKDIVDYKKLRNRHKLLKEIKK